MIKFIMWTYCNIDIREAKLKYNPLNPPYQGEVGPGFASPDKGRLGGVVFYSLLHRAIIPHGSRRLPVLMRIASSPVKVVPPYFSTSGRRLFS